MLISAVLPVMTLYRLPHGQYGYSGHVINLPQDIASFASSLPRRANEVDVIIVRKEGAMQSHHDFRVRRSVVLHALRWLVDNNKYYQNVHINHDALALLPQDGDLTGLASMAVESTDDDQEMPAAQDEDPYDTHLTRTFVPIPVQRLTKQETVRQSVQQQLTTPPTVKWPPAGNVPVNEFRTEG